MGDAHGGEELYDLSGCIVGDGVEILGCAC